MNFKLCIEDYSQMKKKKELLIMIQIYLSFMH